MSMEDDLFNLKQMAKKDKKLLNELLKTKDEEDPAKSFCDKCNELGYKNINLYELLTAGEFFCAAMLRSVNGGGVDAPEHWEDFYEMFMLELEALK